MVSDRKREANRQNAQKPRGPRKKAKAFHPYEDFSTFYWDLDLLTELQQDYRQTLQPQNKLEESLVEMLCHATLRLKRVPYLEHEYHATHRYGFLNNEKENHFGPFYRAESKLFYQQLSRYESGAQRSFYQALNTLLKLQQHRPAKNQCHPDRREGSPKSNTRCEVPGTLRSQGLNIPTPGVQEIPPCGRDDTGFFGNYTQKTSQISHQTSPPKRLKTQYQSQTPPTIYRWLTQKLATVSQKIKAFTQKLQTQLLQSLTGAWGWGAFSAGQTEGPRRATLRKELTPSSISPRGGEPGSAASPAEKASRSQAISTGLKGPDPPDTS